MGYNMLFCCIDLNSYKYKSIIKKAHTRASLQNCHSVYLSMEWHSSCDQGLPIRIVTNPHLNELCVTHDDVMAYSNQSLL